MRTWLGVCCVLALVGCTRDNPAFNDSDTESPPETGSESPTTTNEEESGEASSESGLDPACEPERGPGGYIEVVKQCNGNGRNDNHFYDRWFWIREVEGSVWSVEQCDANCVDCEDLIVSPLTISPVDLEPLAPVESCIHVKARRFPTDNPDSCDYHTIVVERDINGQPVPVLKARIAEGIELPPVAGGAQFGAFDPDPVLVDSSCPCTEFPDACCADQDRMPTTYAWNLGEPVEINDFFGIMLDGRPFEFWALDASDPGECDTPRNMAWALYSDN